jgi:hypothetical protein
MTIIRSSGTVFDFNLGGTHWVVPISDFGSGHILTRVPWTADFLQASLGILPSDWARSVLCRPSKLLAY